MASTLALSSSSPLLSNKTRSSIRANATLPSSAAFPTRRNRLPVVRAQAGGDGKLDVQVNQGNQGTDVEKRPGRLAVDISPFGKSNTLNFDFFEPRKVV